MDIETFEAVMQVSVNADKPAFLMVFTYYVVHEDESPTAAEIQAELRMNPRIIRACTNTLVEMGVLKLTKLRTNKKRINLCGLPIKFSLVASTSSLITSYSTIYYSRDRDDQTKLNQKKFTVQDVEADEDWIKIKVVLLKYFKDHQIHPAMLVGKTQHFIRLCSVWEDMGAEKFDKYAEWYRVNKYPLRKFNFGLFLYPGIISEYLDDTDEESDRYMNTGTMDDSETFKEGVTKTKQSLREIIESD